MPELLQYAEGSEEPVSVEEAVLACRIDSDETDSLVARYIAGARQRAEQLTGRRYRGCRLLEELSTWPIKRIHVHRPSAVVVKYRSAAAPSSWTTLDSSVYLWSNDGNGFVIALAPGQSWPELAPEAWGFRVQLEIDAGPASAADVPECVVLFILQSVAASYDQPGALIDGRMQANPLHERHLDSERLWG